MIGQATAGRWSCDSHVIGQATAGGWSCDRSGYCRWPVGGGW